MASGITSIFAMISRLAVLATRFVITIYITKRLGLAELGSYGIITAVAGIAPTALGFGIINSISRDFISVERSQITKSIVNYFTISTIIYGVVLFITFIFKSYIPENIFRLAVLAVAYSLTEQLSGDVYNIQMADSRPLYASIWNMVRIAVPLLAFIILSEYFLAARSIELLVIILSFGNSALIVYFLLTGTLFKWRSFSFSSRSVLGVFRDFKKSYVLYANDVLNALGQYSDRIIVASLLGPKIAGIYVLFWSIGSALSSLLTTGIMQIRKPSIIRAFRSSAKDGSALIVTLVRDVSISASALSMLAILFVYFAFPYLGKVEIMNYFPVLFAVLFGFTIRMVYEAVGVGLYSKSLDSETLKSAILVTVLSILLNIVIIPILGLYGAALTITIAYSSGAIVRAILLRRAFHQ